MTTMTLARGDLKAALPRPQQLVRTPAFDPLGLGLDLNIELSS